MAAVSWCAWEEESVTKGGPAIPDTAREKAQHAEVVAVGDDEDLVKVALGDLVLFVMCAGTGLRFDGVDYLILDVSDLLAVISSAAAQAA